MCKAAATLLLWLGTAAPANGSAVLAAVSQGVTLSNTQPRLDAAGKVVNAHDGSVVQDPVTGVYYLYGIAFFDCTEDSPGGFDSCVLCALKGDAYPVAYSSPDLIHWKLETDAPNQTLAHNQMNLTEFGDQARVLYNNKTKKYVAINRGRIHSLDGARVAVSDSPIGPFVGAGANGVGFLDTGGDSVGSQLSWYADSKGNAYVAYNTAGPPGTLYPARQCMLELSSDWLTSTGRKNCWVSQDGFGLEGGAVWERHGRYFWAAGNPCCNCEMGGSARVWSIDGDPMEGNWSFLTDINPTRLPMPPTAEPAYGEINPSPSGKCDIEGDWVGSVFLQSGGQPLRGGLKVEKLPDGRFNFSESQPHNGRAVGIGTVDSSVKGILKINLTQLPGDGGLTAVPAVASGGGDGASTNGSDNWVVVHGESCAFGTPLNGTDTVPFLGHAKSAAECQSKCGAHGSCHAYSWCGGCGGEWADTCYGRMDDTWSLRPVGGAVSGCDKSKAACPAPPPPPPPPMLHGIADAWPGLSPSAPGADGCSRISWGSDPVKPAAASITWGKQPKIPEMLYHVKSQMFGMTTLTLADGSTTHMYTGERYQTMRSFGDGFMYWEPLRYSADNTPLPLTVGGVDAFSLNLKIAQSN